MNEVKPETPVHDSRSTTLFYRHENNGYLLKFGFQDFDKLYQLMVKQIVRECLEWAVFCYESTGDLIKNVEIEFEIKEAALEECSLLYCICMILK